MQLRVTLSSDALGEDELDEVVENFTDLDKIAARCARAIKQFIRDTPVRASLHRSNFLVTAAWTEKPHPGHTHTSDDDTAAPRPKRKRKASK